MRSKIIAVKEETSTFEARFKPANPRNNTASQPATLFSAIRWGA